MRALTTIAPALLALLAVARVPAAPQTFFGQDVSKTLGLVNSPAAEASFLAALGLYGTDDLEAIPAFTPDPTLSFGSTGITAATNFDFIAGFPPLAVSGNNLLLDDGPDSAGGPGVPDTLVFSQPVTAFGSYFVNAGDASTPSTLGLILENTTTGAFTVVEAGTFGPGAFPDNVFFFGVTDTTPFNKVTLYETFDFDGTLLDNITVGFAVPEPSAWALGLGGVATVLATAWRCRRRG